MAGRYIRSRFKPAWWLPGPHGQTLWPYLFRRKRPLSLIQERLELPDGDFIDISHTTGNNGPVVVVLHGLEGSIDSPYANAIMAGLQDQGWRGVFMHFRGCSGEPNRLDRAYHSGDTGDLGLLIDTLKQRYDTTPMAAIGYSLGGNVLLKYLGEQGRQSPLMAAVAISVPYNLHNSAETLSRGVSRIYQWHLLKTLKQKVHRKFSSRKAPFGSDTLTEMNTFFRFDNAVTAPLHGFSGADEYYRLSSSRQYLSRIHTPILLIHARDDPFMSEEAIPRQAELSEPTSMELSDKGGHAGFVGGIVPWKADYWLETRIIEYLTPCLS